jgi:hypothetical protein
MKPEEAFARAYPEKCGKCGKEMMYLRRPDCDGFYWDCFSCKDEAILKALFGDDLREELKSQAKETSK